MRLTLSVNIEELPHSVPQELPHLKFPAAADEGSTFSTPLPELVLVWFFDDSHPRGREVASHRGFDLCFSGD